MLIRRGSEALSDQVILGGLLEDLHVCVHDVAQHELFPDAGILHTVLSDIIIRVLVTRGQDSGDEVSDVLQTVVWADDGDLVRDLGEDEAEDEPVVRHHPVPAEHDHVPVALVGHQLAQGHLDHGSVIRRQNLFHV